MSDKKKIIDTPLGLPDTSAAEEKVETVAEEETALELTEGQKRLLQSMRRRNIILGSIFGLGAIALATTFILTTNQNSNVELSAVSDIINDERQVSSYDSEWFANAGDIVIDSSDTAYFSNQTLNHIYKLENGSVEIFAGSGEDGDRNGSKEKASFSSPTGLALYENFLYVADQNNNLIRQIDLTTGDVSTVAGVPDGIPQQGTITNGPVDTARFSLPSGVVVDAAGTLYVADSGNNAIRKISDGIVSTLAGNGTAGDSDGVGAAARFNSPRSIAILDEKTLIVADTRNNKLKTVDKTTGETKTFAGNGSLALQDGTLLQASFFSPSDVLVTNAGNIFVADTFNHAIRVIPRSSSMVYVLTGNGEPGFRDGAMSEAMFDSPIAIVEERNGAVLVVDSGNKTIRRLQ